MKKIHRKVIQLQSSLLIKLCKDIKSLKKSRKDKDGGSYSYTRKNRSEVITNNGTTYKPTNLLVKIKSLPDTKKSTLLRLVVGIETHTKYTAASSETYDLGKCGRRYRIYGNAYTVKRLLCNSVFKKKDTSQ